MQACGSVYASDHQRENNFGMLKDVVHCVWSAAQIDPRRCHSRSKENEEDEKKKTKRNIKL